MRIHPVITSSAALAALISPATLGAYENPETSPVKIGSPYLRGSTAEGFRNIPETFDVSSYYKEYTSPGPCIDFTINAPEDYAPGNTFTVQLWWLDPEPEAPSDTDSDYTSDDEDERVFFQPLDLDEYRGVTTAIINAQGFGEIAEPCYDDNIFWRSYFYNDDDGNTNYDAPSIIEAMAFKLSSEDSQYIETVSPNSTAVRGSNTDYSEGNVCFNSIVTGYSWIFNLTDNNDAFTYKYYYTIGALAEGSMDVIKPLSGYLSSPYDVATNWQLTSTYLTHIPLWNSYSEDDYDLYVAPEAEDYITITSATVRDRTGIDPTHELKFIEAPNFTIVAEDEDEEDETIDPNETIKETFNVSISEDGVISLSLLDDVELTSTLTGTYYFYYRVYVDDGENNGIDGYYFQDLVYIYLTRPFSMYLGDSSYSSYVSYAPEELDEDDEASNYYWYWYSSETFGLSDDEPGWYMTHNFPEERLVYSYEHGWIYMDGDDATSDEGVFWYMYPSDYDDGDETTEYVDDSVGWVWTRDDCYPYFFSYKDNGWIYYFKDFNLNKYDANEDGEMVLDERIFYSYRQKKYVHAQDLGTYDDN